MVRRQPSKLIFAGSNPVSRSGNGPRLQVEGIGDFSFRAFDLQPSIFTKQGPVAQWLAQATHNRLVAGSNPAGPTFQAFVKEDYQEQINL